MAQSKGSDGKPGETPSGPVRPPVLDLKARASETESPKPEASKSESPKPEPAKPEQAKKASTGAGPLLGTALGGGVLGLAAAYGLAWFGLWPTPALAPPPPDPRLAQLAGTMTEMETALSTAQDELLTLSQRLSGLEGAETGAPQALADMQAGLAALTARLDTLPAPAPADTSTSPLLDELAARLGSAEAQLRQLDASVSDNAATLAGRSGNIEAVLQLPLILSGFESAFAAGRPYQAELAALHTALPDIAVPAAIAAQAGSGLARPDLIATRFAETLPAILAGRPADPEADWTQGALDWFRAAIALRPTGEQAGSDPEAVISRLEASIARRDFIAAQALLAELPAPMQMAAGDLPTLIAAQAEAARFLAALREAALSGQVQP